MVDHMTSDDEVLIRKVKEPFGCLGNMSPHPIVFGLGPYPITFPTAEHLFQALRFPVTSPIREEIRAQIGPMQAKFVAKKYSHLMEVAPRSTEDILNMRFTLLCKYEEHKEVREVLKATGDAKIIEDCSKRSNESGLFWGAALREGEWRGLNTLGRLWMTIRDMKLDS